jgi:hypothetical protein
MVIDQVVDQDRVLCIQARTPATAVACPQCAQPTQRAAVHALLEQGIGLLECARRLGWALNTVKRYARAATADDLRRAAPYRETLVDPYRDHLRRRLTAEPGVAVTRLLAEIRERGYTGSANLLVRYLKQGRADPERTPPSPRRFVSWIMTRPESLPAHRRRHRDDLVASCPQLTALAGRVHEFAGLLTGRRGHDLDAWMAAVQADYLPAGPSLSFRPRRATQTPVGWRAGVARRGCQRRTA